MGVRPQHFKLIIKMNNQIYYITDTKLVDMSLLEDGCIVMLNIDSLISLLKLKNRDNLELFKQFCISYREYSYEVGAFTLIHKDIFHLVISKDEELEKYINAQWNFPTHEPRFMKEDEFGTYMLIQRGKMKMNMSHLTNGDITLN